MADISAEVRKLAEDLAEAPYRLEGAVDPVVEKGALKVKTGWRERVTGMSHLARLPYAISYDRVYAPGEVGAEIGYNKEGVGDLGNIREFGTSDQPGHLDGAAALAEEEEPFVAALEAAIEKAFLR